ncbi:hypothetical protein AB8O64_23425 [Streptomyces sp. QH1-20]|uniref:hypothetical protein n=1 Tax=Streptomyces sp. QH1-20 TaxID=3240934 RepID=UPI003511B31E
MSDLIIPTGIPQFVGELSTLEKEAKSLASNAKLFRDSGSSVHSSFQGLSACYKAPEADKLFATTTPVATKSDGFADDLEKVSSALDTYASEVRPLAAKLATLKEQAIAFVASVEGDDDWRKDKKKTDRNDELWRSVNATVAAFHAAERACHDKIVALVGGKSLIADDGSHKSNMYGYKASDLDRAEETPWGSMAEREYTGLAWLRHQAKSFLWDGIVMDGIVGTAKGVATLFGSEGWDKAGEAWTGLAKLATGAIISISPLSGAYWMASDDQLPGWFRDSRTTLKQTGKAFVAYDQWGKNPARAAGGVTFNVLTTITGGAGAAAKGGAVAKTFAAAGKVGRLIDPITYVGKAGKYTFVKVGDLMSSLKTLNPGTSLRIAGETFRLADEATAAKLAERPAGLPKDVAEFVDNKGRPVYMNPKTGQLFDEHGKVKQPAESVPKEGSAAERAAEHARASQPERVPVGAGARAVSDVTASVGHVGDNTPGRAADHPPGGSASHQPGGSADDLRRGPSGSHEPPTSPRDTSSSHGGSRGADDAARTGGRATETSAHTGGSRDSALGGNHAASPHPAHDGRGSDAEHSVPHERLGEHDGAIPHNHANDGTDVPSAAHDGPGLENRGNPIPTPQTHPLGEGRNGFSVMAEGDAFYQAALKAKPFPGHYDIVAHGTPHNTLMDTAGGRELTPRQMADVIRRRPDYSPGTPIRLLSCNTGHVDGTFAQQLARDLDTTVIAPDGFLYVDAWGRFGVDRRYLLFAHNVPGLPDSFYRYHPGGYVEKIPRSDWTVE